MLDIVTREPFNAETPAAALDRDITPLDAFYVRNHFPIPAIDAARWKVSVEGRVERPRSWSMADLRALPSHEKTVVMECAGNGRLRMHPRPEGTPWGDRAVSCGTFRGARLSDVLQDARPDAGAMEALFIGADRGPERAYERSLSLAGAEGALIVYEINGKPLTPEHGAPVRLVVPGWYGVAAVKWLTTIRLLHAPFTGFFQANHYMERQTAGEPGRPIDRMRVKSMVLSPEEGGTLRAGDPVTIRGRAWSGSAPVTRVELSVDAGASWREANVQGARDAGTYQAWELPWTPQARGEVTLLARAWDGAGNVQPLSPTWNLLGYGWNSVVPLRVHVT